jgi:hypothetical protein
MDRVTLAMLIKCAERELGLRQTVYPRKIATGNMSLKTAQHELTCMRKIVELLKETEAEHVRKLGLSA